MHLTNQAGGEINTRRFPVVGKGGDGKSPGYHRFAYLLEQADRMNIVSRIIDKIAIGPVLHLF
jgi:hypothetical protein